MSATRLHTPLVGQRSVEQWEEHYQARAALEHPFAPNDYCLDGVPVSPETYAAMTEQWLERLALEPELHVLDLGCGTGLLLSQIEARVARAVGTDLSEALIRRYRGNAETYACAAHELPFEAEQFDRILVASVCQCFPSFAYFCGVVANLVALLRPGGFLLLADMLLAPEPGSPYLTYNPMLVIEALDLMGVQFEILSQGPRKRAINRRYDIIARKQDSGQRGSRTVVTGSALDAATSAAAAFPTAFASPPPQPEKLRATVMQLRLLRQLGVAEHYVIALTPSDAEAAIPTLEAALAEGPDFELELTIDQEPTRARPVNALVVA